MRTKQDLRGASEVPHYLEIGVLGAGLLLLSDPRESIGDPCFAVLEGLLTFLKPSPPCHRARLPGGADDRRALGELMALALRRGLRSGSACAAP